MKPDSKKLAMRTGAHVSGWASAYSTAFGERSTASTRIPLSSMALDNCPMPHPASTTVAPGAKPRVATSARTWKYVPKRPASSMKRTTSGDHACMRMPILALPRETLVSMHALDDSWQEMKPAPQPHPIRLR